MLLKIQPNNPKKTRCLKKDTKGTKQIMTAGGQRRNTDLRTWVWEGKWRRSSRGAGFWLQGSCRELRYVKPKSVTAAKKHPTGTKTHKTSTTKGRRTTATHSEIKETEKETHTKDHKDTQIHQDTIKVTQSRCKETQKTQGSWVFPQRHKNWHLSHTDPQ